MKFRPLIVLTGALLAVESRAAEQKGVVYAVEPIVGYEFQRKENPDRTKGVLAYGARLTAGYKILSLEAEYTQGQSDERFLETDLSIQEKTQRYRLGLRSTYAIAGMLDVFLRGGAEAQNSHVKTTTSGVLSERDTPSKVYPYLGTGLTFKLAQNLALNASVTATFKDFKDLSQTEFATAFGVRVSIGAK